MEFHNLFLLPSWRAPCPSGTWTRWRAARPWVRGRGAARRGGTAARCRRSSGPILFLIRYKKNGFKSSYYIKIFLTIYIISKPLISTYLASCTSRKNRCCPCSSPPKSPALWRYPPRLSGAWPPRGNADRDIEELNTSATHIGSNNIIPFGCSIFKQAMLV